MENTIPLACTLAATELHDRRRAWMKVGNYGTSSAEIPGGLTFAFEAAPGVYESLRQLVQLESECCPWMTFAVEPISEAVVLTVTAAGEDGERAVRLEFAPLVSALRDPGPRAASRLPQ